MITPYIPQEGRDPSTLAAAFRPNLAVILQALQTLKNGGSVDDAFGVKKTPWEEALAKADNQPPTEPEEPEPEEPEEPEPGDITVGEGGEGDKEGNKMTVAEAFSLLGAGANATGSMLPRPPSAPGLPGAGGFRAIDPTTLMFLSALGRGRR